MILCPVYEASITHPKNPAIDDGFEKIDFASLNEFINNTEIELSHLKGIKIALIAKLHVSTFVVIIALLRLGIEFVLVHPKLPFFKDLRVVDPENFKLKKLKSGNKTIDPYKKAFYFLSSGSSGEPKLIAHSLFTILNSAQSSVDFYNIDQHSTYLCQLPINHVGGLMIFFRMILAKGSILLKNTQPFDFSSLVPTQLHRLLNQDSDELKSFKNCKKILIGGSVISEDLVKKALINDLSISLTYGLSELASQVTAGKATLGHPLIGKEIMISKESEILIKGNSLFLGYGFDPLLPDLEKGYFKTRDLGTYDPKNGLKFTGRKDRMFTKGGENIFPESIESVIYSIKEVLLCCIVDVKDHEYGSLIGCFIEPYHEEIQKQINQVIQNLLGPFHKISYFLKFPDLNSLKPSFKQLKELANQTLNPG